MHYKPQHWVKQAALNMLNLGFRRISRKRFSLSPEEWRAAHISFAQYGEDLLLLRLWEIETQNMKSTGFYVDIGAYDPIEYSNTNLLHKRGWHGINVDINPRSIARFHLLRPKDLNILCGVAAEPGEMTMCHYTQPATNRLVNPADADRRNLLGEQPINTEPIEVLPLRDLLARHIPAGESVDLLDIDCEGMDLEVIRSNDWTKYRPLLLAIEDLDETLHSPAGESEIVTYCGAQGYRLAASVHITRIFVRER